MSDTPTPENTAESGLRLTTCSASWLEKLGGFQLTVNGQELKGWVPDFEDGGTHKCYLDAKDCREVATAFVEMAEIIEQNAESTRAENKP